MNIDSVNKWLTLVANFGVIVGIIFLAIEVNQNNQLMEAEARSLRNSSTADSYFLVAKNSDIASILLKDLKNEVLTELENFRIQAFWIQAIDTSFLSFKSLPSDELRIVELNFRAFFETYPSIVSIWESRKDRYPSAFKVWFDGLNNVP